MAELEIVQETANSTTQSNQIGNKSLLRLEMADWLSLIEIDFLRLYLKIMKDFKNNGLEAFFQLKKSWIKKDKKNEDSKNENWF